MAVGGKRSINQEAPIELSVPTKDGNNNNNNNNNQQQQQYEEESSGDPSASSLNENEELSTMMDESCVLYISILVEVTMTGRHFFRTRRN